MEISTNGYKIPADTDTHFFDYLEFDLLRLDGHTYGVFLDDVEWRYQRKM